MAGVRSIIDELVSYISPQINNKNLVIKYIQSMYLAKLGLAHWAIAVFDKTIFGHDSGFGSQQGSENAIQSPVIYEVKVNDNIEVSYILNNKVNELPPHVSHASILLGKSFAKYMLELYHALEGKPLEKNGESKICFKIDTLEIMLKDLDSKLSLPLSEKNKEEDCKGDKARNKAKERVVPLVASAIYTEIVEPGARILVLNELEKLSNEKLEKILDHLLPRGFELKIEKCPPSSEAWEKVFGTEVICVYPMSLLPSNNRHIRNFIAHGGLTRLSKNWCLAIKITMKDGETGKCVPYAVCIVNPLDERIMRAIANPS